MVYNSTKRYGILLYAAFFSSNISQYGLIAASSDQEHMARFYDLTGTLLINIPYTGYKQQTRNEKEAHCEQIHNL